MDESATRRTIFASAMRVGRDHIASTVYTLVLAYAGGALPCYCSSAWPAARWGTC